MVRVIFDPSIIQVGRGGHFVGLAPYHQRGYGAYYTVKQRGAGIGDVFRRFWRIIKPFAQSMAPIAASAGKAIGEEGLATTARVLSDIVQGGDIKDSLANQAREGAQNLLGRAQQKLQKGSGREYKRKHHSQNKVILKSANNFVGRLVPSKVLNKRRRIDNLGSY